MAEDRTSQLEADSFDEDLQFEESDAGSATSSLNSSIYKYRYENGRTYHAYKDGKYWSPNDEVESERLDLQHHLFTLTFNGKLFTCPAGRQRPIHRVLDVGTGTGIWAIDFADEHPEAHVIGIDLSPIQPSFVPPNLEFQIDDLEEDWTFSQKFDFIHSRMMTSSFADWPRFFEQCFANLNPGGYIELADICFPIECDDDSFPENSALKRWTNTLLDATIQAGRPINGAKQYKSQLEAAGFINVVEKRYKWPQNRWPKDPAFKELGMWSLENIAPSLEGFSMALFTRILGWTKQEVETYLIDVRKELKDVRIHGYFPIYAVYGQKPLNE